MFVLSSARDEEASKCCVDCLTPAAPGELDVSRNVRDYVMMRKALEFDNATDGVSARVDQLCERMGIDSIAVTFEFPFLACSY